MALSKGDVAFLQGLVAQRPERKAFSRVGGWFVENYGLGAVVGRHLEYKPRHFEQAREILALNGLPVTPLAADASRADAARFGGQSEKSGSRSPWSDSVAVKWAGEAGAWNAPGCFAVLTIEEACALACDRILLVENLETFRWIRDHRWLWETATLAAGAVLVVYRGDTTVTASDALELLRRRSEPVVAFTDFDPAGLGIAAALPRLEALALPHEAWLRNKARGTRAVELYARSRGQYEATLDAAAHPAVAAAWTLLKELRAGVAQEAMRDELGVWLSTKSPSETDLAPKRCQ